MSGQRPAEWFEDYSVGDTVTSPAMTVTADDVRGYSRFTNDVRPVFRRRREDGVDGAEGAVPVPQMYLFSLGVALLLHSAETYIPRHFVAFFGFDLIEFHHDVRSGTVISSTAIVSELVPRGRNGLIAYRHRTSSDDGRLLVSSSHRILVKQRGADD
jgi:acyl dehydratase